MTFSTAFEITVTQMHRLMLFIAIATLMVIIALEWYRDYRVTYHIRKIERNQEFIMNAQQEFLRHYAKEEATLSRGK